jgi:hypothetical protein
MPSKKRFAAKFVVSSIHHAAVTTVSTVAIKSVVQPEADSVEESVCELGGFALGTAIWWKTEAKVSSVVDLVADKRAARKLAKQETPESE